MESNCSFLPYEQTGFFSKIIIDYLNDDAKLHTFFSYKPSLQGIEAAITNRKNFSTDRTLLVETLKEQYYNIPLHEKQQGNVDLLLLDNTFTITTAHQPNIFTGHLYFIYKILHVLKIAEEFAAKLPAYNFVPVYYMGSEDADLDELGHINVQGNKLEWKTKQTGAVGRMKVDKALLDLIDRIAGQLEVEPFGKDLITLFRKSYQLNDSIQYATLKLVDALFKAFGLLVIIPDNAKLKSAFHAIVKQEITEQFSYDLVQESAKKLQENYKVQASGRALNLFYLNESNRERIQLKDNVYTVESLGLHWTKDELLALLESNPEMFSANVILRGLFQELILPNIVFVGGGGEIAYWLELKNVFAATKVPYPVLVLRNSFLCINVEQQKQTEALGFTVPDLFATEDDLVNRIVKRESNLQLNLDDELNRFAALYEHLKKVSGAIDPTLAEHVATLQVQQTKRLSALEKKMLRAEKRKFEAQQRQVQKLKSQLFPNESLQERIENFAFFYARYGDAWINEVYKSSRSLQQEFGVITLT